MAIKGESIYNSITGETLTFLETASGTSGEKLVFDLVLKPGSKVPMKHLHSLQDEIFETVSGVVKVEVGGVQSQIRPGEKTLMPKMIPHMWWNPGKTEARLTVTFIPALNTEEFFVEMFALANAGKSLPCGSPTFKQAAVMCSKYNIYHPKIPVFLQKTVSKIARTFFK